MINTVNIVIPSIELSEELKNCLIKLNNQRYKFFFVTIVLDFKNKNKLPKLNYKINSLIVGKKNMSYKRNLAVKKFKSDIIAFIDSDTYAHKSWLSIAVKILANKKKEIIGGPSVPFPKQKYSEFLCHCAKRSFFLTGYMNFRKYKSKSRYCDWLESCNMLMHRKLYLDHNGMNISKYLGEDKEFIERIKNKDNSVKVFFTPKLFIYHKERSIGKFLLQRLVFGSDLFNIIKFRNEIRSFQPMLPLLILTIFAGFFFINIDFGVKIFSALIFVLFIEALIFINVNSYVKDFKSIFLTIFIINLANISYVLGGLLEVFFISRFINKKIYLRSRQNK